MTSSALVLAFVVPVFNESEAIVETLASLQPWRAQGHTVVVVDGGSSDGTVDLARPWADTVRTAPRGRASQMNCGAAVGQADVLVFLHADTRLPSSAVADITRAVAQGAVWGRFDVGITGRSPWLPVIAFMMNLRSRLTGIATGDQAIFVRTATFAAISGYADQPLMEDIDLSRRLRLHAWPACLRSRVQTSGRRWDQRGVWRTVWLMWCLRWRYWRGEPAEALAKAYQ